MNTTRNIIMNTTQLNLKALFGPRLLFASALALLLAAQADAGITVTSLNDSGPGSLRQAIADAPPGETIDFAVTGTISLTSGIW